MKVKVNTGDYVPEVSAMQIFRLIAARYKHMPDDFVISIGHHAMPFPERPMGPWNQPEFQGYMSLTMRDVLFYCEFAANEDI